MVGLDGSTTFEEFIRLHKEHIYSELRKRLPSGEPKQFTDKIMRVYIDRKGKYVRPSFLLLWNLLYKGNEKDALLPAAIQQMSEDTILIHDDILDNNKLRRGSPSAHVLYGLNYAIIAGDALQSIMWEMVDEATTALKGRGKKYYDKIHDIWLKTNYGQYYDVRLTEEVKDITKFTLEDYYRSIHAKSSYYTVYGPMQCGAIVAGSGDDIIEQIPVYGTPAGNAFQIKDDILDCISNEALLGKTIGNDIKNNAKTIILWHAVQNADTNTLKKIKQIYEKTPNRKTQGEVAYVIEKFKDLGSIDYAEGEAQRLVKVALNKFDRATTRIRESNIKITARDAIGSSAFRNR